MNKIKNYLLSLGMSLKHIKSYTAYNKGKVCFGGSTYDADVYEIIGTDYRIHHKHTGRLEYRLYKGYCKIAVRSTQTEFCKLLQETIFTDKKGS